MRAYNKFQYIIKVLSLKHVKGEGTIFDIIFSWSQFCFCLKQQN